MRKKWREDIVWKIVTGKESRRTTEMEDQKALRPIQEIDHFYFTVSSICPGLFPAKFSYTGAGAEGKKLGSSREGVLPEE